MQREGTEGVVTATSNAKDVELVAQELARQLIHPHLGFVLFFCSAEYDLQGLGEALEHSQCGAQRQLQVLLVRTHTASSWKDRAGRTSCAPGVQHGA